MQRPLLLPLLLIAVLSVPGTAFAAETLLSPVSPWNVEWRDKTCTLSRAFGTTEDPLILRMERFAPGDGFQLVVVGKALANARDGRELTIAYGDGKPDDLSEKFMFGTSNDGIPTLFVTSGSLRDNDDKVVRKGPDLPTDQRPQVTPAMEEAVTSISLRFAGQFLKIKTGSLGKPFVALRQCTDDLVKQWGFDPEVQSSLRSRPVPLGNPGNWIRSDDYPRKALANRKSALVTFRLSVDASGTPVDCDIQRAYADDSFKAITCGRLMVRARFKPALDASGQPTPSYYVNSVRWVIY